MGKKAEQMGHVSTTRRQGRRKEVQSPHSIQARRSGGGGGKAGKGGTEGARGARGAGMGWGKRVTHTSVHETHPLANPVWAAARVALIVRRPIVNTLLLPLPAVPSRLPPRCTTRPRCPTLCCRPPARWPLGWRWAWRQPPSTRHSTSSSHASRARSGGRHRSESQQYLLLS